MYLLSFSFFFLRQIDSSVSGLLTLLWNSLNFQTLQIKAPSEHIMCRITTGRWNKFCSSQRPSSISLQFFFYILFSLLSDFSLLCMPSHCEPSFLLLGSDTDLTGGPCHSSVHISYFLFAFSCSGVACFVHRVPLSSLYNWSYNFARNETTLVVCSFYLHKCKD